MDLCLAASSLPGLLGAWNVVESQRVSCGDRFLPSFRFSHNASVVRPNRAEPLEEASIAYPKNHWTSGIQTGALGGSWDAL